MPLKVSPESQPSQASPAGSRSRSSDDGSRGVVEQSDTTTRSNALGLPAATSRESVQFSSKRRTLFAIVGFLAIVFLIIAYWTRGASTQTSRDLLTHRITQGNLRVTLTEKGTLESSNNTEIKCNVRGYSKVIWAVKGGAVVEPGDTLVRLDTKQIEEEIGQYTTDAHVARATYERTKADVANAEIAIDAYLNGTYRTQLKELEKQLEAAQSALDTAEKVLVHSETMFRRGYLSKFEVQANRLSVMQAELEFKVRENAIEVLNKYTKEMEMETLRGNLNSLRSKLKADEAGLAMDEGRRDRAIEELEDCEIKAERGGLVIYPSSAAWKTSPDVTEGATVRKDQVLLLMPDLSQMQIKIGVHESIIDRVKVGMPAKITLPDMQIEGSVSKVASIARPSGWWTGNNIKYDAIIDLPQTPGLKPGMTAEVEVLMAEYTDVLTIPVSAVVETEEETFCWVETDSEFERRDIQLGDSNDVFIIVESGLEPGDNVALNPLKFIDDAEELAQTAIEGTDSIGMTTEESGGQSQ